jgi:predicted nucleotidyltransferase
MSITIKRVQALSLIAQHKPELARRFGVSDLALFGSVARDTAQSTSDIDILVSFEGPANSARYFGTQFYLEDLLGCPVDLVTDKALRPELRAHVTREAIHV